MQEDDEGFLYPKINDSFCTKCGLCVKICPVLSQGNVRKPLYVYAAKNPNEKIRRESSSGGIFTLLAEKTIRQGGVVFGAQFNEKWEVIHDYTETVEGLAVFRGSKYVQSVIGNTYKQVKDFLETDRTVMFSGTPCQIAGLKAFLQKDYDKLLAVDLVCHGVPSPAVWREYLDEVAEKIPPPPPHYQTRHKYIKAINFRDKTHGWRKFSVVIHFNLEKKMSNLHIINLNFRDKSHGWKHSRFNVRFSNLKKPSSISDLIHKNPFGKGFLQDLYLRPICYNCFCRFQKSGSDITLGDYWGIQNFLPEIDDDLGVSLLIVNNKKGKEILSDLNIVSVETAYSCALKGNPNIEKSVEPNPNRVLFFQEWKNQSVIQLINRLTRVKLTVFIKDKINFIAYQLLSTVGLASIVQKMLKKSNK
jgi:coenzyme F420-reducing hydrogenase beta subunit